MFWNVALVIGLSACGISHTVPVVNPVICPPEGDHYLAHENCSKFIVCSHGYYHEFDCPQYTYWHPDKERCDYGDSVCYQPTDAPTTVTTERSTEPTPTPSDPPTDTPPTDGTTEPTPTPSDPTTELNPTESSTSESSDGTTKHPFACPPSGEHTIPHYSACNLYYRCKDGYFYSLNTCGPDWFDSESESCVAPEDSDCPYLEYDDLSW